MQNDDDILLWRLAETLTLTEAALLAVDINPAECRLENAYSPNQIKIRDENNRLIYATRFRTVYCSILAAARAETLNVTWCRDENTGYVVEFDSTVKLIDLKKWFESRGFKPKIFFPDVEVHEFKDPDHPRYAPKLAAVVGAWEAIKEADPNKTVKQTLVKWLNLNAAKYELLGEDGLPRANIIQELAGIANWEPSGGAPKTRSKENAEDKNTEILSEMDIENVYVDDSEIPF